jgi:hypothetical protein
MIFGIGLWTFMRALVTGSAAVALENLALRHQLLILQRSVLCLLFTPSASSTLNCRPT